jgi:hypothetical protein
MVAPFIGLTGGASLLHQLVLTNPASMVAAVVVLWGVAMLPLGEWTTSWRMIDTSVVTPSAQLAPSRPSGPG